MKPGMTDGLIPVKFAGLIDGFEGSRKLLGWVMDANNPDGTKVKVTFFGAFGLSATVTQGTHRPDLVSRGSGNYGFQIDLDADVQPINIVGGCIRVTAAFGDENPVDIPFETGLQCSLSLRAAATLQLSVGKMPQAIVPRIIQKTLKGLTKDAGDISAPILTNLLNRPAAPPGQASTDTPVSQVLLPSGLRSGDLSAKLGRNGYLFLTGGTNALSEMYHVANSSERVQKSVSGWIALFKKRKATLNSLGVHYIQMIVPEKNSMLPHLLPGATGKCSPFLEGVETAIRDSPDILGNYLSAVDCLSRGDLEASWKKVDSHLTPYGSRRLYAELAEIMGHEDDFEEAPEIEAMETGDLAARFLGRPMYEAVRYYGEAPHTKSREKTFEHMVIPRHTGHRREWKNPQAPIKKRVMSFGNSFMDGINQSSLSYWLSANCIEYKFTFDSKINVERVAETKPDFVICQTVERYLQTVPPV